MRDKNSDEFFMGIALGLATEAAEMDEVPVGAIIVKDGEIISTGKNQRESNNDATAHSEVEAIKEACKKLGGWNLHDCEMYVTLEPCPMCAGAIINSRIKTVIIGTKDCKSGAFGGCFDINSFGLNHKPDIITNVLSEECTCILKSFFKAKRERGQRWTNNK